MPKIARLPPFVADQIAAGEVVENPSSAIKELLENAIDAGATEIYLSIEGGGLKRICIEDDGCGMDRQDACLCLQRHATSKLRDASDLQTLLTMGFRGEALAALASVSKLELKTSDGNESTHLIVEGGEVSKVQICARSRGTSVEIKSLFFNAPARLKFQKSAPACAAAVLKVVQAAALAYPEIRFQLLSNGKPVFDCQRASWKERAEEILGAFAHEVQSGFIRGLLARPEEARANRSGGMIFVNRRPIFSPLLAKAVKEGFGTRIEESLFPSFLLFLELPPDTIDVNVHPQKKEIRFQEEGKVYGQVLHAVSSAFQTKPSVVLPWENFTPGPSFSGFAAPIEFRLEDAPMPLPIEKSSGRAKAVLGDYLLIESEEWLLVDLRGAEARILFEEMEKPAPKIQNLLWPIECKVDAPEEMVEQLALMNIEARAIGKQAIAIDAAPQGLEPDFLPQFIEELGSNRAFAAKISKTCRSVRRCYSLEAAAGIWDALSRCNDKLYDPLGNKIVVPLHKTQLARFFE